VTVTVLPAEYHFVKFDSSVVSALVEDLLDRLAMSGRDVVIEIDETTPLTRAELTSTAPVTLKVESGAYEEPKAPRTVSEANVLNVTGRLLLRVRDREQGGFADAPADAELSLPQTVAWDVYSTGRLQRLGVTVQRQRWLYHFRNRHGFTDDADAAFDRLWSADRLTWAELSALSEATVASSAA